MDADAIRQIVADAIAADRAARAEALANPPPAAVNVVGVKLPDFWTADPTRWFKQVEARFRRSNITVSSTKYDHVLMKLPEAVVASVGNLIDSIQPTDTDGYERIKERLVASYSKTPLQRIFSLIRHPDIGDRRPSAMLNEMSALLPEGCNVDDLFFIGHFLIRLPVSIRDHLAASGHKTAAEMARHADALWDARAGDSPVSAVSASVEAISGRSSSPRDSRRRSPDRRRAESRGRQPPRRPTPGPDGRKGKLCFYHGNFGTKAVKCEAPCSWVEN